MASLITVLHISDPQFGEMHRFGTADFETLEKRLKDDLNVLASEHHLRPNLVVVSGDLAEKGKISEFKESFGLLKKLAKSLSLEHERIAIIPGNHDLNRPACESYFKDCESLEEEPVAPFWPKWKNYATSFDRFYSHVKGVSFTEDEPWTLFEMPEIRVVVAGLNSTMDESHEGNRYGFLGERQLLWFADKLHPYRDKGWLRIGAVHHNLIRGATADDQNLRDFDMLERILGPYLNVILHGHTHSGDLKWLASNVPIVSTGSAGLRAESRPGEVPNQYQILRFSKGHLFRYARHYVPDQKRWVGDTRLSPSGDDWKDVKSVDFQRVTGLALHNERLLPGARVAFSSLGPEIPPCYTTVWSPDWKYLATGHTDGSLRLWDPSTGREMNSLHADKREMSADKWEESREVSSLSFSPNCRLLASGSADRIVRVWNVDTGDLSYTINRQSRILTVALFSENLLAEAEAGNYEVRIWNLEDSENEPAQIVTGNRASVSIVVFSATGRYLATGSDDGAVRIWDLETKKTLHALKKYKEPITSLAFNVQGDLLASGSRFGRVRVWSTKTGDSKRALRGDNDQDVSNVMFSPDGKYLSASFSGYAVKLWDAEANYRDIHIRGPGGATSTMAFSPDGLYLASASQYHAQVWNFTLKTVDPDDT